jgi:hypothetical protein
MLWILAVAVWTQAQTTAAAAQGRNAALPDAPAHSAPTSAGRSSGSSRTIFDANAFKPSAAIRKTPQLPDAPSYRPLTPKQKFHYFTSYAKSPMTFASALVTATSWHAYGDPPYGPGWTGFGKSYGAALSQAEIAAFLQRFAIPTVFHQDPRYFRAPDGQNVFHRGVYAVSRLFLTKADSGADRVNASYLLGGYASAAIGNAYIRNRDYQDVTQDFFLNMGTDAAFNIVREFWPSVRPKCPGGKARKVGDLVIGSQGLPNPEKKK